MKWFERLSSQKDRVGVVLAVQFAALFLSALLVQSDMWLSDELSWLATRFEFFESMAAISHDPRLYLVHFGTCVVVTILLTPWYLAELMRTQTSAGSEFSFGALLFGLLIGGLLLLILNGHVDGNGRDGPRGALFWLVLDSRIVLATLGSIVLTGFTTLYVLCLSPVSLLFITIKQKEARRA